MEQVRIGRNIRRLRDARQLTQEQVAQALNVSFQAVSKWEKCVTVPDTLLLPKIAAFFNVTIDELFLPEGAYPNNAQRLLAVYESSREQDDFIRADAEFRKLFAGGTFTRDDERSYGILYEYHMYYCRDKALKQYEKLLSDPERDWVTRSVRQQRIGLLSRIGRGGEAAEEARAAVCSGPDDPDNHLALISALYFSGRYEEVLEAYDDAAARFGDAQALFHIYAGDACGKLHRYGEAFAHWEKAAGLDPECADPLYSMAFGWREQGDYAREKEAWERVSGWLEKRGFIHELAFVREQIRRAGQARTASAREAAEGAGPESVSGHG